MLLPRVGEATIRAACNAKRLIIYHFMAFNMMGKKEKKKKKK
jgi:hypothetical protein